MSYRAIVETLLYLEQFRNIDLFQQGFYFLKFQVYYETDEVKVISSPTQSFKAKQYQSHQSKGSSSTRVQSFHCLSKSEVSSKENSYNTQIYYVRYAEEKVYFSEVVKFRTEIETNFTNEEKFDFYLKVDLMFLEASEQEIKHPKTIQPIDNERQKKFKLACSKVYKINQTLSGVGEFFPVTFDSMHFANLNLSVHSFLIDFKFRKNFLKSMNSVDLTQCGDLKVILKPKAKPSVAKKVGYDNLTSFLFQTQHTKDRKIDLKDIERIHTKYIKKLIKSYDRLRKFYQQYMVALPSDMVGELLAAKESKFKLEAPQLIIQHNEMPFKDLSLKKANSEQENSSAARMNSTIGFDMKSEIDGSSSMIKPSKNKVFLGEEKRNQIVASMKGGIGQQNLSRQSKISKSNTPSGLKINCLDNLCTKSKLDEQSQNNSESISKMQRDGEQSSLIQKFKPVTKKENLESIQNLDGDSMNFFDISNVSSILEERMPTVGKAKSPNKQFLISIQSDFCKILDEAPLSELDDHLPSAKCRQKDRLTPQIVASVTPLKITSMNMPPKHKGQVMPPLHSQSLVQKNAFMAEKHIQNKKTALINYNSFKENVADVAPLNSMRVPQQQQNSLQSFRSMSQNHPHSPKKIQQEEPFNGNETSQSPQANSERKNRKGLDIPHIKINQRNLQTINDSQSFLALFLRQLKSHKDPEYVTTILDSEVKQIAMQIFQLWNKTISIIAYDPKSITKQLRDKYTERIFEQYSQKVVVKNMTQTPHLGSNPVSKIEAQPTSQCASGRKMSAGPISTMSSRLNSYSDITNHYQVNSIKNFSYKNSVQSKESMLHGFRNKQVDLEVEEEHFGVENSPSKISRTLSLVDQKRKNTEGLHTKKTELTLPIYEVVSAQVKNEYDPLIVEERYINKCNKWNKITKSKSLNRGRDEDLSNTIVTDMIETLKLRDKKHRGIHLFVFVHGFQASSFDMRTLKNQVALALPGAVCLSSTSNENSTEGSIEVMGKNLAKEVQKFINEWCITRRGRSLILQKLSFVGHSLGGLIIRSALPLLSEYKDQMHGYMSLGSPHLGYMYNSGSLFNAGMWVLKRWRNSQCLQQLSMTDMQQKNNAYLFKLSKEQGLNWFKHVIFTASYQDNYAPHDSARVQICSRAAQVDKSKGSIYVEMANNILDQLKCEQLLRLDVNFRIDDRNLDSYIGRTAHILLMECQPFVEILVNRYRQIFCE